ncbi:hypothetical protein FC35_GL001479 [Limosilactobacillus coleohominis DSM 14060]|nr:hypothetical protein FC35_GL001479 [Limosilactobacillus coleohominis DSM 14060]
MRKLLLLLSIILSSLFISVSASADLKSDVEQSNNPNTLTKYINSTTAGKSMPVKKVTHTEDNNYTVYVLKKKPKVASLAQRVKFAKSIQTIMDETPQNFRRNGIAFYQGSSNEANFIVAFNAEKISSNYAHAVQSSRLGSLDAGTTACYFEPYFAKDDANGGAKSSPDTQGKNAGPDGETLIETIQDVTE